MTKDEMLRIIAFSEQSRAAAEGAIGLSAPDPSWKMALFLVRRHFEAKLVTVTTLAAAADAPYATAMRRIEEMIDEGLIVRRPRSRTGKSFSLHPSQGLIDKCQDFALRLKGLVGEIFGLSPGGGNGASYYFGGSYLAARIIAAPTVMRPGVRFGQVLRILTHAEDPTFSVMWELRRELSELLGGSLQIERRPLDELRIAALANAEREESDFDIIACDLPWIGEFATRRVLLPLDEMVAGRRYNFADFFPAGWKAAQYGGQQYGIPMQTTPELLFVRKDLLSAAGLPSPRTSRQVVEAARRLHAPAKGLSGIAWNGARGTPIAHTFVQILGAFGRPMLNIRAIPGGYATDALTGDEMRPTLDTLEGRQTAEYLLELLPYSAPDVLEMDWHRRVDAYRTGRVAMAYEWSVRAGRFELDAKSPARGRTEYLPHPRGPRGQSVSTIGGFVLGIPRNLRAQRIDLAWRSIEFLTSPEVIKLYVQNGSLVSPRFCVSADPEIRGTHTIIGVVEELAKAGQIQLWPRPPIPQFTGILSVLGEEIHDLMLKRSSVRVALARAQDRVDQLMRQNGCY